jgi:hypothetical protein
VRRVILAGASALALATVPVVAAEIEGRVVWSVANEGGSEIVAHDPERRLAYVVGGLTLDVLDAGTGERVRSVSLGEDRFEGVNSVAVSGDVVAVSATAAQRTDPGAVLFYRAGNLRLLGEVAVGAVPDAVVFTPRRPAAPGRQRGRAERRLRDRPRGLGERHRGRDPDRAFASASPASTAAATRSAGAA